MNLRVTTFCRLICLVVLCGKIGTVCAQTKVGGNPSACGLDLPITDNNCPENGVFFSPNLFEIDVTNAPGNTLGVDVFLKEVRLIIEHDWAGDLDLKLISPSGIKVELTSDNGGGEPDYGTLTLGDCSQYTSFAFGACKSITDGIPPFTDGPYRAEEQFYLFNDGTTDPNGTWMLEVCDDVEEDDGKLQYIELIFEPIQCLPISELSVISADSTTLELDWFPGTNCGTTIIEYGPAGFTPGIDSSANQGTIVFASCPPFLLEGLPENAIFDIYVRKFCGGGGFAGNSCPISVKTGCQPPSPTIIENFDDLELCQPVCEQNCAIESIWRNAVIDDFDWIVNSGATATLGTGPTGDADGDGNYVYLETSGSACNQGAVAHLVSNCIRIDKQGSDTCHLSFNYHMFGTNVGHLSLEASRDGGFNWSKIWEKFGNQGNSWHKVYLALNNFDNDEVVQFRFTGAGATGSKGDVALDNIVFYGSQDLGVPFFQYYLDVDEDGFGQPGVYILSCEATPPEGYVTTQGDCNDADPTINPDSPEIPCDNVDNNCNAATIDDDPLIPPPIVTNDTICSGELAEICATPNEGRPIFWYASPTGDDFVGFGACLRPNLPPNRGSLPVVHRFYAEETDFSCFSVERSEAVIVVNPNPNLSVSAPPDICPGDSIDLGSLNVEESNFTGAAITFHSGLPASTENEIPNNILYPSLSIDYYVHAETEAGCQDDASLPILLRPGPTIEILPADSFSLCKDATDTVQVRAIGGSGSYKYRWSGGETSPKIGIESAFFPGVTESYRVTVTDGAGCLSIDSVLVTTTTSIDSVRRRVVDVTQCAGNDGSIELTPLNGQGPFRYQWTSANGVKGDSSSLGGLFSIDGLEQGAYRITITDNSDQACDFVFRSAVVNGPDAEIMEPNITHVSCFGVNDGEICIDAAGENLLYLWNTGDTTSCITGLSGGDYAVTVTQGECLTVLSAIVVEEPDSIRVAFQTSEPSCANASDGAIDASVFGGTGVFSYNWSNGETGEDIEQATAGTYLLNVMDSNGCSYMDSLSLGAPPPLSIRVDSLLNMSCTDVSDGLIKVSGVGGTPPYRYQWNNGAMTPLVAGLAMGNQSVVITDFNGCSTSEIFSIANPSKIDVSLVGFTEPDCIGDDNGEIIIAVSGGSPPYVYAWNNGSQDSVLTGIGVGEYLVTVTDRNSCSADTLRFDLTAKSELKASATIAQPTCIGRNDGSIELVPDGQAPFSFQWSRGDATQDLQDVGVGTFGVTIEDAQGCILDTAITVDAPQVFDVEYGVFQPSCFNSADGVINVNLLQSGQAPLAFAWNTGSNSQSLVAIQEGAYVLTVTDGRGCTFVGDSIEIFNPPPMKLAVDGLGAIRCHGDETGFIELSVSGGIPPYNYDWLELNANQEDVYNLGAGSYRILIQDVNDCPLDTTFIITQPNDLVATVELEAGDICSVNSINRLRASASGGVLPYEFTWNTGSHERILNDVPTGDYELFVRDANGCTDTVASIKLKARTRPWVLDTFYISEITCNGANDGAMTAIVSGGSSLYRFHFSNNYIVTTRSDSITRSNLALDESYQVTVTDMITGCAVESESIPLAEPLPLTFRLDSILPVQCTGLSNGAIFTNAAGGTPPYTYQWFDESGTLIDSTAHLLLAPSGRYSANVMDANGCNARLNPVSLRAVGDPIQIVDSLTVISNVNCFQGTNGEIDISVVGGTPPLRYNWNNGQNTQDLRNLPAGSYQLTIADSLNCTVGFPPFIIEEPDAPLEATTSVQDASCAGSADGKLSVSVTGGDAPYLFSWKFEDIVLGTESGASLDSLKTGTYFLIIRDRNKCVFQDSFEVREPNPLRVQILKTASLPIGLPLELLADISGGTPPYEFLWSNGATTQEIEALNLEEYQVTVTDAQGCTASASSLIVDLEDVTVVEKASVFPNPSTGLFQLKMVLKQKKLLSIQVTDTWGRRVFSSKSRRETTPIDLSNEANGLYFLRARIDGKVVFREKIILIR